MEIVELPIEKVHEAPWNPNRMDGGMLDKLAASMAKFDLVQNLVVRPNGKESYEVLSGNQRLKLLREAGYKTVPCVIKTLDDAGARLLAQALNRIEGVDDLGLKASLMKIVLGSMKPEEVIAILPESAVGLKALTSMDNASVAEQVRSWQNAQAARLKHMQFQLTSEQLPVVQQAINKLLPKAKQGKRENPNNRGTALFLLCQFYLETEGNKK